MRPAKSGRNPRRVRVRQAEIVVPSNVVHTNEGDFGEQNDGVIVHSAAYSLSELEHPAGGTSLNLSDRVRTEYRNTGDFNATNINTDLVRDGAKVRRKAHGGERVVSTANKGDGNITNNRSVLPEDYNLKRHEQILKLQSMRQKQKGPKNVVSQSKDKSCEDDNQGYSTAPEDSDG
ncbi:hypothetical protein VNI00_009765 [Paramarasmius palmivorus]|uniref:Uncharacterized protein n=1 Tax=Paramarasmius palmivorus TaxID=297713 RepID=A0AAW0CMG5_9AGAR